VFHTAAIVVPKTLSRYIMLPVGYELYFVNIIYMKCVLQRVEQEECASMFHYYEFST
jgi:hypothetical protein